MSYATVADLVTRLDSSTLASLVGDSGTTGQLNSGNPIIVAALGSAKASIMANVMAGGIYTAENLDELAADSDPIIVNLTCDLAMAFLFSRRSGELPPTIKDRYERANRTLEDLRAGKNVFPISTVISSQSIGISIIDDSRRRDLDMISDSAFFPRRRTRQS